MKLTNYSSPFQSHFNKSSFNSTSLSFPPNSRWTKQSFAQECDINTLMARYMSTGEIPNLNEAAPQYLDATGFDFHVMQNQLVEAQSLFDALPSKIRSRFGNDPGQFLDFVGDPDNRSEMAAMGLLNSAQGGYPRAPITSAPPASEASMDDSASSPL